MTEKEVYRSHIVQQVRDKKISQVKAGEILKISDRQVRNLLKRLENEGVKGLISKKRGKRSNRAFSDQFKEEIVKLIADYYEDFGPSFAREKLMENHGMSVSVEAVRQLMMRHHLHISRRERKKRVHYSRPRRENFGELIQIDASIHDWFEGRGEKCALIVFIDDATSQITHLHFHRSECLEAYFIALEAHLKKYGRPLGIYSDRHSIFGGSDRIEESQLNRAFKELDIEGILARSPQAKGRVERANRTLQDRLIKEMRLKGISSIEEANAFVKGYVAIHNKKFSKKPKGVVDTHRPLDCSHDLSYILSRREARTVSNGLSISFYNKTVHIVEPERKNRLKGQKVQVIERKDGKIEVYYHGRMLKTALSNEMKAEKKIFDYKDKIHWKPKKDHPWRRYSFQLKLANEIKKMEREAL